MTKYWTTSLPSGHTDYVWHIGVGGDNVVGVAGDGAGGDCDGDGGGGGGEVG